MGRSAGLQERRQQPARLRGRPRPADRCRDRGGGARRRPCLRLRAGRVGLSEPRGDRALRRPARDDAATAARVLPLGRALGPPLHGGVGRAGIALEPKGKTARRARRACLESARFAAGRPASLEISCPPS